VFVGIDLSSQAESKLKALELLGLGNVKFEIIKNEQIEYTFERLIIDITGVNIHSDVISASNQENKIDFST